MNLRFGLLLTLGTILWTAGCGSSNNSTVTGVTMSCTASTIQSAQLDQCNATVTGTGTNFETTVTWKATAGSISAAGLFTAPTTTSPVVVTITATSTQNTSQSATATVTVNPVNLAAITVDAGPQPQTFTAVNEAFVSVTVCVPDTTTCQTIDHILVDTGSSGLRLLSSLLTVPLPQQLDSSGNPLDECLVYLDGYVWGPVASADIEITGEKGSSVPVQVIIPASGSPAVPSSCSGQTTGPNEGNSVSALGANGILGVSVFQQDCGMLCTGQNPLDVYYSCPSSGCSQNGVAVPLAQQVPNPVTMFSLDNNGVLLALPSVPAGGVPPVNGSLIFGVGTQSNNVIQSATVYTVPASGSNAGDLTTMFNGVAYPGFLDSGSNGIFFLDGTTTGIATCTIQSFTWYCPTSPANLTATNQGMNGNQGVVNFSIQNATTLLNSGNIAFSTLGAPMPGSFDWGLAFFYGRSVFTAAENANTPSGAGPYVAY